MTLEELGSSVSDTGPLDVEHSSRGVSPQCNSNSSSTCDLGQPIDYAPLVDKEEEEEEESRDQFPLRQVLSESNLLEFSMSEDAAGGWGIQDAVFIKLELQSPVPCPPSPSSPSPLPLLPLSLSPPTPHLPSPSLPPHLPLSLLIHDSPSGKRGKRQSRARADRPPTEKRWDCKAFGSDQTRDTLRL